MIEDLYKLTELSIRDRQRFLTEYLDSFGIGHHIQRLPFGSNNIIIPPTSHNYILVCAHYDFVGPYGANDNASGVRVLMELARRHSIVGTRNIGVMFCFTDCEEGNLIGSKWLRDDYMSHLPSGCYNLDMVGVGDTLVAAGLFKDKKSFMYDKLSEVAAQNGTWLQRVIRLNGRTSDYERFMDMSLDSISLIALPYAEASLIQEYNQRSYQLWGNPDAILDAMPTLNRVHDEKDHPKWIEESTLCMVTESIWETILKIDSSM